MIRPVRCFTCGKNIGHLWTQYSEELKEEYNKVDKDEKNKIQKFMEKTFDEETIENRLLDKYGLSRYCCRRMFLSQIDMITKI